MPQHYRTATLLALFFCLASGPAAAENWQEYAENAWNKFQRGAANSAYGWLEIPKNMVNEVHRNGCLYLPVGLGEGFAYMLGRTAVGMADLLSFPLATAPLAEPAMVWEHTETDTRFTVFGTAENGGSRPAP